jgi:TPR repeat protein
MVMQRFDENGMILGVRRYCGVCSVVVLGVLFLLPSVRAQQNEVFSLPACVPSDLAALIVPDGRAVRVSSVSELAGPQRNTPGNAAKGGAAPSPSADRAASEAYKIFQREARQGRPAAMVNLAVTSLAGWGPAPNAGAALYWLHAAADRGYAPAYYNLGILYFKGCGVPQDFAEALRFFAQAARGGDAAAAVNLGYLYTHGLGVTQDHAAAARWYRQAAEVGEPQAQFSLADVYLHGEGVAQDDAAAFAWFRKAALQGHTGARIMLGSMYAAGRGTPKDLPSAYLWMSAAALQGDPRGNATLLALEAQLTPGQLAEARLRAPSLAVSSAPWRDVALLH